MNDILSCELFRLRMSAHRRRRPKSQKKGHTYTYIEWMWLRRLCTTLLRAAGEDFV